MDTNTRTAFIAKHGPNVGPTKAADIYDHAATKAELAEIRRVQRLTKLAVKGRASNGNVIYNYQYSRTFWISLSAALGIVGIPLFLLVINYAYLDGNMMALGPHPSIWSVFSEISPYVLLIEAVLWIAGAAIFIREAQNWYPSDVELYAHIKLMQGGSGGLHNPVDPEKL